MDSIPIVGLQHRAFECAVIVSVMCNCDPSNTPFMIQGLKQLRGCPKCGNFYGIQAVLFDREQGMTEAQAVVVIAGRKPVGETVL